LFEDEQSDNNYFVRQVVVWQQCVIQWQKLLACYTGLGQLWLSLKAKTKGLDQKIHIQHKEFPS